MTKYGDLIGIPYLVDGRDENGMDCYGLLRYLYPKENGGVELPDYQSPGKGSGVTALFLNELRLWRKCEPRRGAAVLFRVPGNIHVGIILDDGEFIHTWEKSGGVVRESLSDWKNLIIGVYEYAGA